MQAPAPIRATVAALAIMVMNAFGLGNGVTGSGFPVAFLWAQGVAQPSTWTLFGFGCLSLCAITLYLAASRRSPAHARTAARR